MVHTVAHRKNEAMQRCIEACSTCATVCTETIGHCLEEGGRHSEPSHIRLMLDCADLCDLSARFMTRESAFSHETCRVCAAICRSCAESCESISAGDTMMKRCADVCLECASECEKMARAT